jgi:uncharacterized protein (DUF2235 family)
MRQYPCQQPKNIILLSDGTGNSAAKVWRTNVWRLFTSLDLANSTQVAFYDDGVGSASFKPLALLGGIFGWGLKRNVLDLYTFLCRNHKELENPKEEKPNVYAFGFSRGAFTIRVLLELIENQGLIPHLSEEQLRRDAKAAYRAYRRERYSESLPLLVHPLSGLRDAIINAWHRLRGCPICSESAKRVRPRIRFVGLWDTVAAYGLPIDEIAHGVDLWIRRLQLPPPITHYAPRGARLSRAVTRR